MSTNNSLIERLKGVLIVSCQAERSEPLGRPEHILALSLTVINGGAGALRLEGVENVELVRKSVDLPIVALSKTENLSKEERLRKAYITPSFQDARALAEAGADIIALDATGRERSDGLDLMSTIEKIHEQLNKPVWADCSSIADGIEAARCGADLVSTTLFGYTAETALADDAGPSFELLSGLIAKVPVPVVLEGRVWHPQEVTKAFELGAHAVVVGSAITRPHYITRRFLNAIPSAGRSPQVQAAPSDILTSETGSSNK